MDAVASTGVTGSLISSSFFEFGGEESNVISATSYPSGSTNDTCHPDTAIFSVDSANLVGTYALSGMLKSESGATVTASLVNLTDGSPDTALVSITSTSAVGELQTSTTITFAAAGATKEYAIKTKVSANSGFAWGLSLTKTS